MWREVPCSILLLLVGLSLDVWRRHEKDQNGRAPSLQGQRQIKMKKKKKKKKKALNSECKDNGATIARRSLSYAASPATLKGHCWFIMPSDEIWPKNCTYYIMDVNGRCRTLHFLDHGMCPVVLPKLALCFFLPLYRTIPMYVVSLQTDRRQLQQWSVVHHTMYVCNTVRGIALL